MNPETNSPSRCAVDALFDRLIEICGGAKIKKVYASTQYGMGFILAEDGFVGGGIVFRDDKMSHAERVKLADKINTALSNVEMTDAKRSV